MSQPVTFGAFIFVMLTLLAVIGGIGILIDEKCDEILRELRRKDGE